MRRKSTENSKKQKVRKEKERKKKCENYEGNVVTKFKYNNCTFSNCKF